MTAQSGTDFGQAASGGGEVPTSGGHPAVGSQAVSDGPGAPGAPSADADGLLLTALLDGMDAALCAFDAEGVVTHWNREAERVLGWSRQEAVGRRGLAGWAAREADAPDVEARLLGARDGGGRQVDEFALVTKDGRRVLVRTQSSRVTGADGRPCGVYCAFSDVHAQLDLERSIALSGALFEDATWGVVVVDADLRPAVVGTHAARILGATSRATLLGRPLAEFLDQGLEELENALSHVLAQGAPPASAEFWVTLRAEGPETDGAARRCWRSGFLRLASPLAEEPVPLGVAWLFQDVTESKRAEQERARTRFRDNQLHRAARAASECEDASQAATTHLDFALAGFADHALLDLAPAGAAGGGEGGELVRAVATPVGDPGPHPPVEPGVASGFPVGYGSGHPAVQAYERGVAVRTSVGGSAVREEGWATSRKWPHGTVYGLCTPLRSRGRTLGVVTFLRGESRRGFDRGDVEYAGDVAVRVAALVDLARSASSVDA